VQTAHETGTGCGVLVAPTANGLHSAQAA